MSHETTGTGYNCGNSETMDADLDLPSPFLFTSSFIDTEVDMDTVDEEGKFAYFPYLPRELRVEIYKQLEIEELLRMRQVCQEVKDEIDNHIDFHVKLDQSYRGFRRLGQLRVVTCRVVRLTQKNLPKTGLFKYPHRVKKLIFDGSISIPNLKIVLNQCQEVEQLVFTHETLGTPNLVLGLKGLENLKQVTHINLQLLRYPLPDPTYDRVSNMLAFMRTTFPRLTSFKLYFSVWGQWVDLFLFLQRHARTLTELELQVGDRCDTRNTQYYLKNNPKSNAELLEKINMKELKQLRLKEFQFRDDVLCLNATVSKILIEILKVQNKLEIMQFHSPGDLSLEHLELIVRQNDRTLEELVIYNLKNDQVVQNVPGDPAVEGDLPPPPPQPSPRLTINMNMFSRCKNMRTLALSCVTPNRIDMTTPIKMIHLEDVPVSVERFHTLGFAFLGDDIINLSRQSPNLKELLIMDAGSMKFSSVISNVLKNCADLEFISIRPIVPRGSSDEAWMSEVLALGTLYSRFMGVSYDPIDDLDGFEAHLNDSDRDWIRQNIGFSRTLGAQLMTPAIIEGNAKPHCFDVCPI